MDIKNTFSAKDYFNYFFAGFIWIIDYIIYLSPTDTKGFFQEIKLDNFFGFLISSTLLLIVPFIVGFILNPLANFVTKMLRKFVGEPTEKILVLPNQSYKEKISYKRLAENYRSKINKKIQKVFGKPIKHNPFYYVRAYVEEKGSDSTKILANRALDLANMAEGLIIPVSIFGFLITKIINIWLGIGITAIIVLLVLYRYIQLREYWVKHIYRAFLVINE